MFRENGFTPVMKNIFVEKLSFCQETLYRLLQPGCLVISVPGQLGARCTIIELHCLVTVLVDKLYCLATILFTELHLSDR